MPRPRVNYGKCLIPLCAREAEACGYCYAHRLRVTRGETGDRLTRPVRKRGKSPRAQLLEEVIRICEHGGTTLCAAEIAEILRRLKP